MVGSVQFNSTFIKIKKNYTEEALKNWGEKKEKIKNIKLSDGDWKELESFLKVEESIHDAHKQLEGRDYVTSSYAIPLLFGALNQIKGLPEFTKSIEKMKDKIINELSSRLKGVSVSVLTSSFFDSRFKTLDHLSNELKNLVYGIVKQDLQNLSQNSPTINVEETEEEKRIRKLTKKPKVSTTFNEFEAYLLEKEEDIIKGDPLLWWKQNCHKYPLLSRLAKKYLSIQASSAESESTFSDLSNILTDKRLSLIPETVCKLLFCKRNANVLNSLNSNFNEIFKTFSKILDKMKSLQTSKKLWSSLLQKDWDTCLRGPIMCKSSRVVCYVYQRTF